MFLSGNKTRDDQPNHLRIHQPRVVLDRHEPADGADHERVGRQPRHLEIGDQLVEHGLEPHQRTGGDGLIPRNADQPAHRRHGVAEQPLQRDRFAARLDAQTSLELGADLFIGTERPPVAPIPSAAVFVAAYGGTSSPDMGVSSDDRYFSVQVMVRGAPDGYAAAETVDMASSAKTDYEECLACQ